jgi:arsenate reductase-like glutaredoxin family protein
LVKATRKGVEALEEKSDNSEQSRFPFNPTCDKCKTAMTFVKTLKRLYTSMTMGRESYDEGRAKSFSPKSGDYQKKYFKKKSYERREFKPLAVINSPKKEVLDEINTDGVTDVIDYSLNII